MSPLHLHADFHKVLDLLERDKKNLFITGRAGTGKSTLLQLFRKTTDKKHVVLAPTGVAALNVRGQTIHSFFNFPPRLFDARQIRPGKQAGLIKKLDLLLIDEISMVRADILDAVDYCLRKIRNNALPFGGVQVAFFGDLFQLPPVVTADSRDWLKQNGYATPYFFSAHLFYRYPDFLEMFELRKIYRQDNLLFIRLLEAVRTNTADNHDLSLLNERCGQTYLPEENHITLCARNHTADRLNQQKLDSLDTPAQTYIANVTGNFPPNLYPTELGLTLKKGAQIMILRNDPEGAYVNGSVGTILSLEPKNVVVSLQEDDGLARELTLEPTSWEILQYHLDSSDPGKIQTETLGTFTQLPVKLAWGVTIHKAQGKTFQKLTIDLEGGAFEFGQTYVALSRCRSLEGIILKRPLQPADLRTDPAVLDYYRQWS